MAETEKTEKKQKRGRGAPKEYLFKPGQSGNPAGRPVGTKNFNTIFNEAIKKIAKTQDIDPKSIEIDLIIKGISEARGGNYQFWRDIFDRNYGKPQQKLDLTTKGDKLNEKLITDEQYKRLIEEEAREIGFKKPIDEGQGEKKPD